MWNSSHILCLTVPIARSYRHASSTRKAEAAQESLAPHQPCENGREGLLLGMTDYTGDRIAFALFVRLLRPIIAPVRRSTICYGSSSFRCRTGLPTALLPSEHLLPQDFFNHAKVVGLAVHDVLQIFDILAQFVNLAIVKCSRITGRFFNVKAGADVDYHLLGICKFARDVERRSQGHKNWFVY